MSPALLRSGNTIALLTLIAGKVIGIIALVVGSANRTLGAVLLGLAGVLVVGAAVLCVLIMRGRSKVDDGKKAMLAEMKRDGTLDQYLRELEAEATTSKSSPPA